jgi:hypothetical protein
MIKEDVINLMLESMNSDNRSICKQGGMAEDEMEAQITASQTPLLYMLSNMYDRLKSAGVLS